MSVRAWLYPTRFFSTGTETEITVTELSSFGIQTEDPILGNIMPKKVSLKCLNYDGSLDYLRYKRDPEPFWVYDNGGYLIGDEADYVFYKVVTANGNFEFRSYTEDYYRPKLTTGLYCIPPTPYHTSPYSSPKIQIIDTDAGYYHDEYHLDCYAQEWQPLFLKVEIDNGSDPAYTGYYFIDFGFDANNIEFDDSNQVVTISAEPMEGLLYRLLEHVDPWYSLAIAEEYDVIRRAEQQADGEYKWSPESFYDGVAGETTHWPSFLYDARTYLEIMIGACGFSVDFTSDIDFGFVVDWEAYGELNAALNRSLNRDLVYQIINLFGGDLVFKPGGTIDIVKRSGTGSVTLTLADDGRTLTKENSYTSANSIWKKAQTSFHFYAPIETTDSYGKYVFSFGPSEPWIIIKKPAIFFFKNVSGTWRAMNDTEIEQLISGYIVNYYETVDVSYFGLFTGLKKTFTYKSKTHLIVSMDYDEKADRSQLTCRVID